MPEAPLPATASDARGAALLLFQVARAGRPAEELRPLVGEDLAGDRRVALRVVLDALRSSSDARVVGETPAGHDKTAVDVEATLAGGGIARYQVQATREPDGTWRIVSIAGPGVTWPPLPPPRDEGLTTSQPPGAATDGAR